MAGRLTRLALLGSPRSEMRSRAESAAGNNEASVEPAGTKVCELCQRESPRFTDHHLVPRSRGGKFGLKARLCPTCHRQLHAMFSEATLAKELNSIETLRASREVATYLIWARRQKGPTNFRVRRANNRR